MSSIPPVDDIDELLAAKERTKFDILGLPGVVGVGLGDGNKDGLADHISIYAQHGRVQVPKTVESFVTLKRVIGPVRSFDALTRPVPGGSSCGAYSQRLAADVTGTNGMVLASGAVLSCNHVYCGISTVERPTATPGGQIWQPGDYYGGGPGSAFASLSAWQNISETGVNTSEWALATPLSGPGEVTTEITGIGVPTGYGDAVIGTPVVKSGALSGLTQSTILDTNATIQIDYEGLFTATYDDQLIIDNGANFSFGQPGDSGSVVITLNGREIIAVGLLIGGAPSVIVANKMSVIQPSIPLTLPFSTNVPAPSPLAEYAFDIGAIAAGLAVALF